MHDAKIGLPARFLLGCLKRWGRKLSVAEREALRLEVSRAYALDYEAHEIKLWADSDVERDVRSRSCAKEPMTVKWLESGFRAGDIFYDIGANTGAYSLVAARVSACKGKVYAFEPSFQNFYQLCRNVILNECQTCVTPLLMPLCAKSGLSWFYYQNLDSGGALHSFGRRIDYKGDEFQPSAALEMAGFSLDDFVNLPGVLKPNLLKLDVDGLELEILKGARSVLRDEGLRGVLVEINEDLAAEASEILALLAAEGLVPYEKHQLHRSLFNYFFARRKEGAPAIAAADVPVASRRRGKA
jgi:FkbM family methyltransferase